MCADSQNQTRQGMPLALAFLIGGLLVVLISMTFDPLIPAQISIALRAIMAITLVALIRALKNIPNAQPYRRLCQVLAAATIALFLSWYLAPVFQSWIGYTTDTPMGIALAKLVSAVLTATPLILITRLFGMGFSDLYLKTGRLRTTVAVGLAGFFGMAALAYLHPQNRAVPVTEIISLLPSILIFIFANATVEELLFRGLFLKQLEATTGAGLAAFSTSLVFAAAHLAVTYTPDLLFFVGLTFILGLVWAFIMQRTDSIIGSILFHAGADVVIVLGVFHSMGVRLGG